MKILYPKKKNLSQIKSFFIKKGLNKLVKESEKKDNKFTKLKSTSILKPDLLDLYNLYWYIYNNKRTTILEFGSGWSSLIFSLALNDLRKKFGKKKLNFRRNNLFELFILENAKKFLNITRKKINSYKLNKNHSVHFCQSVVEMTTFNNLICTKYKQLPMCNPDFIYLDGPDQFNIKGNINGISTRHYDMMPMACDILRIEYFLTPGTIIVCDGRGANAKFLKDNLKRKWIYKNDNKSDQHIFLLKDPPLGKLNKNQLKFYWKD